MKSWRITTIQIVLSGSTLVAKVETSTLVVGSGDWPFILL
jgi:hypothetical protein